jgi:hypothetical protein
MSTRVNTATNVIGCTLPVREGLANLTTSLQRVTGYFSVMKKREPNLGKPET